MSNSGKKTIEQLKQDQSLKVLDRAAMDKVTGGKRRGNWFRRTCGGIMPQ